MGMRSFTSGMSSNIDSNCYNSLFLRSLCSLRLKSFPFSAPEPGGRWWCGIGSNFGLEAPGRMPGPRGAGILPATCNSQVSREGYRLYVRSYWGDDKEQSSGFRLHVRTYSPASLRTAARVVADTRKRSLSSWSSSGMTAGIRPSFLASSKRPNVPVIGIFSSSAARLPRPSSRMTSGDLDSRARARTEDSPRPKSAARGSAGALTGWRNVTHASRVRSGTSQPCDWPICNSSSTA